MEGGRHPCPDRALVGLAMQRRKRKPLVEAEQNDSAEDASLAGHVHNGAVRTWLKTGLEPIDLRRSIMIFCQELNRFVSERRPRSDVPCPPGLSGAPTVARPRHMPSSKTTTPINCHNLWGTGAPTSEQVCRQYRCGADFSSSAPRGISRSVGRVGLPRISWIDWLLQRMRAATSSTRPAAR